MTLFFIGSQVSYLNKELGCLVAFQLTQVKNPSESLAQGRGSAAGAILITIAAVITSVVS